MSAASHQVQVKTTTDRPKYEAPQIVSLRWLRMVMEILARSHVPLPNGLTIVAANVQASLYMDKGRARIAETGWEHTGNVYALVTMSDGEERSFGFDTHAVNQRDTRYVLSQIYKGAQVDLIMASDMHLRALREATE
jgi:hypothetical protein